MPPELCSDVDSFLNKEFYSLAKTSNNVFEIDKNIETNEKYKNIFELRLVKNKFLIEKMPKLVKNYCLITYDELTNNFINIMNKIKECGLEVKNNIEFPLNISYYKKEKNVVFIKKVNEIPSEKINNLIKENTELLFFENLLFPSKQL